MGGGDSGGWKMESPPSPVKEAHAKESVLRTGEERQTKSVPAQLWTGDGDQ